MLPLLTPHNPMVHTTCHSFTSQIRARLLPFLVSSIYEVQAVNGRYPASIDINRHTSKLEMKRALHCVACLNVVVLCTAMFERLLQNNCDN